MVSMFLLFLYSCALKMNYLLVKCVFSKKRASNFCPEKISTDFEMAQKNALKQRYPDSVNYWCLFYFSKNIWRKNQGFGLINKYKTIIVLAKT